MTLISATMHHSHSVASNHAIIIDMTTNKNYRFTVSRELFHFLHEDTPVTNDRTSKFDAFVHLLELATLQPKRVTAFDTTSSWSKGSSSHLIVSWPRSGTGTATLFVSSSAPCKRCTYSQWTAEARLLSSRCPSPLPKIRDLYGCSQQKKLTDSASCSV